MEKLGVGILGATGAAGLEFVRALDGHPWFEIEELYASEKNAGKTLEEACSLDTSDISEYVRNKTLRNTRDITGEQDLICSALPPEVAKDIEENCAKHTPVISTTSAFRYENDVPILITEVNAGHYKLLKQQKRRGWRGWIAPGPNCTTVGLAMSLHPIYKELGVKTVTMSSYQAVSGGGYALIQKLEEQRKSDLKPLSVEEPIENPQVILDRNVIGYIPDEEAKVKKETLKILGKYTTNGIEPAKFRIDCSCVRVPTLAGHFETVFIETEKSCSEADIKQIYAEFNAECKEKFGNLPSSPRKTVVVLDRSPQPFLDAGLYGGMAVTVGRIEGSDAYDNGIKYQVLSNNTQKGAAKGIVQVAEYLRKVGILEPKK